MNPYRARTAFPRAIAIPLGLAAVLVLWIKATPSLASGGQALQVPLAFPPQPAQVSAFHRSGQTFLAWEERADLQGESYRVYRYDEPITSGNIGSARLLYQVPEGSATFFANRYYSYGLNAWTNRYLERYVIEDHGAQLPAGTGLLVWTLSTADLVGAPEGQGYYAITTVVSGTENLADFGLNSIGPVAERVDDPQPVEVDAALPTGWHAYIQYMDLANWNPTFHAPNAGNRYYGLDSAAPGIANAIQYAYDYAVFVPGPTQCGSMMPASLPVLVTLHAWGGNSYSPPYQTSGLCAYTIAPVDEGETWWFGFARDHDFRLGGSIAPDDVIVNYTEDRVLRMVYDLFRDPPGPPADENRVYLSGHSMGGSGALAMALRYPNVFAAAYASKAMTDYRAAGGWKGDVQSKWGRSEANLPVVLHGPSGWADPLQPYAGMGVWDWQDAQQNLVDRQGDDMVPLGLAHGINDTNILWDTQGQPAYAALNSARIAWGAAITDDGHNWGAYRGLPPSLQADVQGTPFAGLQVVKDETVPGLSNASANPPIPPTAVGGFNQTLLWSSSWNAWDGAPVDEPDEWGISICAVDPHDSLDCGSGITQTVDVTPRRLQRFEMTPGATYRWENRSVQDNHLINWGQVVPDEQGLLTVTGFLVSPAGSRLWIFPAEPISQIYLPSLTR